MRRGKFAAAINCIDGRAQMPVSSWMKETLDVNFIDRITEPGPDKILSLGARTLIETIKKKVLLSINAHHSNVVAIAGHHDCAGNPVTKEEHVRQIKESAKVILSWGLPIRVMGLWVNEKWEVEVVCDTGTKKDR